MSDDALRELLESPLDDRAGHRPLPPSIRAALFGLAGAAAGALVAGGTLLGTGDDPAPAATTLPGPTPTTAAPGMVTIDGGLAVEAAWVMQRGDALFVGVHFVSMPGTEDVDLPGSAAWVLRLDDGRHIGFRADHTAFIAPGVVSVEFPAQGIDPADLDTLLLRPAVETLELTGGWEVDTDGLPWSGPPPGPMVADGDLSIVASSTRIGDDGGALEWQLLGTTGRRAIVDGTAAWTVPGEDEARVAAAEYRIGGTPLQLNPLRSNAATSGSLELYRLDDPDAPTFRSRWWGDPGPVTIDGLSFEFRVTLFEYAETGVEIPLAGVPVVTG